MADRQRSPKEPRRKMRQRLKDRKFQPQSLTHVIPNLITVMAICSGLSAVRFAFIGRYDWAVGAILLAAIMDVMDGRLARLWGSASRFGAELDSFADLINYGLAPGIVMYWLCLHVWNAFGWLFVIMTCVCATLRLARFNTASIEDAKEDQTATAQGFFTGVPTTPSGLLILLPLILQLAFGYSVFVNPYYVGINMAVVSWLMISRIPTFSTKKIIIQPHWMLPLLLCGGIMAAAIFMAPWAVLAFFCVGYWISIPLSVKKFYKIKKQTME